ncbi:paraneoplastic antigen Ma1 homolog [Megalobrama amblycephala]|uniref:paraneoplastic antigen Ma1 homolog n=1 Tax=Megalobrama amblycephala TaxID=75352 RepID=UPI002013DF9B|nr:paraneoplastic antigen Ma1 homolog [Megalobrama amblycephala]
MDLSQTVQWSREESVSFSRAIVLSNVPLDASNDTIEKVLNTVKVFGRTRIRGRRGDITGRWLFILVETSADLDPDVIPPEIGIENEAGPWSVNLVGSLVAHSPATEGDTFQLKLQALLQQEGRSIEEVKAMIMENQPPKSDLSVDLVDAIGKLVDRCNQVSSDGPSYRKLRLFSGLKPVPPGEEEYEVWMEQAAQMISEWQCTESAKKQRIVESLRGPAADIVRFLKVSSPSATANDYLAALDTVYGTTENGPDLMAKFRHTYQESGEKLSAFLYHLDKLLHRALLKGGIDAAGINRARMEQLIKGALSNDMVALRIRMTHTVQDPPSFSQLMKEVREEEHWVAARENVKASVANVASPQVPVPPELHSLKKEVKELSIQVSQLLSVATVTPAVDRTPPKMPSQTKEATNRDNVHKPKTSKLTLPGIFCYNCGEDGHKKWECKAPEDLRKVNQKLMKIHRLQGNLSGAQ